LTLNQEALAFIAAVNKDHPGSIVLGSDMVIPKRFTSGSLSLDVALGGGWPGNQWVEVLGNNSAGKTFVTLKTIAANQALDPEFTTFWVAAEHYDTDQALALGVDLARVTVAPTRVMETGLEYILTALETKGFDAIVLDSYPALSHAEELGKAMDEFTMAGGAKVFNKFWRKAGEAGLRDPFGNDRPFLGIVINQWRDKIGGFSPNPNAPPRTSPGGQGKDYAFYTRVDVKREEYIVENRPNREKPVKIGQKIAITTIKNKSFAPQEVAKLDLYFRDSITTGFRRGEYDLGRDYATMGVMFGAVEKSGAWLKFEGEQFQGMPAFRDYLRGDLTMQDKLRDQVLGLASDPRLADKVAVDNAEIAPVSTRRVSRRAKASA
jgi:recombination protein RecA